LTGICVGAILVMHGPEVTEMDDSGFPVEMICGVPVVTTPLELDLTNAPRLESALSAAAPDGTGAVVVDMSRTRFCDIAGLRTLLMARTRLRAGGGDLLLVIGEEAVLRILELTGADRLIRLVTDVKEAIEQASDDLA
jgi:anti-sigma B factor antagonist